MIELEKVLNKSDRGLDIFKFYLPEFDKNNLHKKIKLRDEERTASASIHLKDNKAFIKDFGTSDPEADAIGFVMNKFGLTLPEALDKINTDLRLGLDRYTAKKDKPLFEERPFTENDLKYFAQFGIMPEILSANNVISIARYFVKEKDFSVGENELVFGYKVNGAVKIYRPKVEKFKFIWIGVKPVNYKFGFDTLSQTNDLVIIAAGEKDTLTLKAHGYNAFCLNSESENPSEDLIKDLKQRFKTVAVLFDIDQTGTKRAKELSEKLDLTIITLPDILKKYSGKDVSDYFKNYHSPDSDPFEIVDKINPDNFKKLVDESTSGKDEFFEKLIPLHFTSDIEIQFPEPIISVESSCIATPQNLFGVTGISKGGKTGVIGAMIASAISHENYIVDCLGFTVKKNVDRKAVLTFDCEQSVYNFHKNNKSILKRAGFSKEPDFFKAVLLRELSIKDRLKAISILLERYSNEFGGIHLCVIDGIADLVVSVNDEEEANGIVDTLSKLSIKYNTVILVVLHLNPSSENKSRGHLGSQLERKAESIIKITKKDEVSTIEAQLLRNGSNFQPIQFIYDTDLGYHVGIGQKPDQRKVELVELAGEIFNSSLCKYSYTELCRIIKEKTKCSERKTKSDVALMKDLKIIDKENTYNGKYYLCR